MKTTAAVLLTAAWFHTTAAFASSQLVLEDTSSKQCPIDSELSCHNKGPVQDRCCFNQPGGLLLLTQFWDANPATGPGDSWTLHGLWPDNCDGSYEQYCDSKRYYKDIPGILQSFGKSDLLQYMRTYWKDWQGNDPNLWEHEWNKHGTCVSTLETACYPGYKQYAEMVDYLETATQLFKKLDTYKTLAAAGITPHASKTYELKQLQAAISKAHGMEVTLNCKNSELKEVWYFFNVKGSVQTGKYVPTLPAGSPSNCPATGIKYTPKNGKARPNPTNNPGPTPTKSSPAPTGTNGAFSGKGHLEVTTGGKKTGCLISYGTWYSTGTCAMFHATSSGNGFTLSTTKGDCGIADSVFACDTNTKSSVFTAVDGNLAVDGKTTFFADKIPTGTTQVPIYTENHSNELTISWKQF
ncbi:Ribonuclease T2 precursor (RNase T2) [Ophidiomyces ophidiicola]|nr:Ribonuclease T2 precursor (RNase T2) [Ophidiomyces ophidiicola]KAI2011557.1 Ribonuclease T2 precursor (RNase T2) [Ophidiomyces ophidiicola]KAI2056397.1 Ribonuclease T2 precursor (RNase T2) [Ophidiomyces ophidiicola]KAI2082069.1 Ribonuclease T2 precursor (RNase T2) [Ophidiomyces ophidiicola]KAI2083464.1 Ribonuclease T2 precursor (RNase T2) [Ophidiomyces ophidiicola]